MVARIAYAYCVAERSSRGIERRCCEDVALPMMRHGRALADLLGGVLGRCVSAGLVEAGVLAVDGMKLAAWASNHASWSRFRASAHQGLAGRLARLVAWCGQHEPPIRHPVFGEFVCSLCGARMTTGI
jgi:hypothetical protein